MFSITLNLALVSVFELWYWLICCQMMWMFFLGRLCVMIHMATWICDLFHDAQTDANTVWCCSWKGFVYSQQECVCVCVCVRAHVHLCAHCIVGLMSCCHICFQDGTVFSYAHPGTQVWELWENITNWPSGLNCQTKEIKTDVLNFCSC